MLLFYLSLLDTDEEKSKLEKLYYQYKSLMKYIALDILKDEYMSEDAVHEAFIKLTRHLDGIEEIDCHKTKAFLIIIVRNVALDILRKERKMELVELGEISDNKEYNFSENINVQEIYESIRMLPDTYRDIIELKVYYEYSDKKIADLLGISHQAVRKRLQRARNALAKSIEERCKV